MSKDTSRRARLCCSDTRECTASFESAIRESRPPLRMARMRKRIRTSGWAKSFERSFVAMTKLAAASGARALAKSMKPAAARRAAVRGSGTWTPGFVLGAGGTRRYRLYRPAGITSGERLPLLVMLHGCGQDAEGFAASTRMNTIAARERFLVLYPEQDRLANAQGCWNWFETKNGRAHGEAALILQAIDQVCRQYPADPARVAVVGLSAGASMAALLASLHPERFRAVVMHSGVPPGAAHSALTALRAMHGRGAALVSAPTAANAMATASDESANHPPLLVIHGDADAVVSPHNGQAAVQAWADATGARAGAVRSVRRGKRLPMTITDYRHGGRTAATLVTVKGLAHAWSGGASSRPFSDGRGPDASRMAWAFAAKQFRATVR
jgi:poly(hydroxyalkanoate) depolymerase family esterase